MIDNIYVSKILQSTVTGKSGPIKLRAWLQIMGHGVLLAIHCQWLKCLGWVSYPKAHAPMVEILRESYTVSDNKKYNWYVDWNKHGLGWKIEIWTHDSESQAMVACII